MFGHRLQISAERFQVALGLGGRTDCSGLGDPTSWMEGAKVTPVTSFLLASVNVFGYRPTQ